MIKEVKAIIFDVGGVLYEEPMDKHYSGLCKIYNFNLKELYKIREKYTKKATLGKLSSYEYPSLIAEDMGIKNKKEFYKNWIKVRKESLIINKDVERTIIKLKKNYIIGTLTNITKTNDKIRKNKKVYKHFKVKVISNKVGLKKPDIRFYKLLIKKLNLSPNEIVFIDDEKKYIKPAKKLGMKTILFKNNKQLIKDFRKLGVKI